MSAPSRASEAFVYWKLSRAHTAACIAVGAGSMMAERIREDISAIAIHSEWPLLRKRAGEVANRSEQERVFG